MASWPDEDGTRWTLNVTNQLCPVKQVLMSLSAGEPEKKLKKLTSKGMYDRTLISILYHCGSVSVRISFNLSLTVEGANNVHWGTRRRGKKSKRNGRQRSLRGKAFALLRRLVRQTKLRRAEHALKDGRDSYATPAGGVERLECGAQRSRPVTSKHQEVAPSNDNGTNGDYMGGSDCSRPSLKLNTLRVETNSVRTCLVELGEQLPAEARCCDTPPSQLHKPPAAGSSRGSSKRSTVHRAAMKEAKKLGSSPPDGAASFPPGHASTLNSVAIDDDRAVALIGGRSPTASPSASGANNNGGCNRACVSEETSEKHQEGFGAGRALRLFRSSSLSPRSSWRVGLKPSPPPLLTHFTYPSPQGEFPVFSAGHLMSIRGSKVKTSPRHSGSGSSSLSVPSSPKTLPSPPRVPPHLRKHRRTVSALAQSFFTSGNSFRGRDLLESPMQEGSGRTGSIKGSPRNFLRRLKSMSGGLVASEGSEGKGEKYRVEPGVTKLYRLDAKAVTEELTVLDAEIFRRIKVNELRSGAWTKKDKVCVCVCVCVQEMYGRRRCVCVCVFGVYSAAMHVAKTNLSCTNGSIGMPEVVGPFDYTNSLY